jgi:hypothetical protein
MKKTGLAMCCCLFAVLALAGLPPADEAAAGTRLLPAADVSTLDAKETAGLVRMREEEKLARDVYLALYATWGKRVFSNIIESEQRHMDAVKSLLDRYQLKDPVADLGVGVFATPAFQDLHDSLVADGIGSLAAALEVGVKIEEMDIEDLELLLATDNPDIKRVYSNLLRASQLHLKTFQTQLQRLQ